jgi:hypothetical protein
MAGWIGILDRLIAGLLYGWLGVSLDLDLWIVGLLCKCKCSAVQNNII